MIMNIASIWMQDSRDKQQDLSILPIDLLDIKIFERGNLKIKKVVKQTFLGIIRQREQLESSAVAP